MKSRLKKIMTLLMTTGLIIGSIGTGSITASAEETKTETTYESTDPYVIYFSASRTDYTYTKPYYWVTPYLPSFSEGGDDPTYHWPILFNMVNTSLIDPNKTEEAGPYASVPAYCTDIVTGTSIGTEYRRINLEDSSYYNDDYAGKIRAIFLNSFPFIGPENNEMQQLQDNVNAWLGTETVSNLTNAEALSATQTAIWIMSNSDESEIYEYCMAEDTGIYVDSRDWIMDTVTVNPDPVDNKPTPDSEVNPPTEQTIKNIESLCKYLLALDPMPAQDNAISEHSLKDITTSYARLADGTYDVTVSYNVDAEIVEADDLIISVGCGDVVKAYELTKGGQDSITINVPALGDVKLEINGIQTTQGDVYLYEAIGGRKGSQNMVAYDTNPIPVHAEVVVNQRVLNFYKTTNTDQGRKALEGVTFDIYLVTENLEAYNAGEVALPEKPTEEYAKANCALVTSVVTDEQGKAVCLLSTFAGQGVIDGTGDGIYLIVERGSAAVVAPIDPFFVYVPMTNAEGTGYVYNINVEPKNTVVKAPDIYKDVTRIENNSDTFDVNEQHTWIIRGTVPADIADAKEYKITDVLDYRLTYKGNMVVKAGKGTDAAGTEAVTLTPGTDYTVQVGKTSTDGKQVDKFNVYLTQTGMDKVAEMAVDANVTYEVRVYFDTVINTNAQTGVNIPNYATLDYTNAYGYEYDVKSDIPEVHMGGLSIWKHDAKDATKSLSGAIFKLAQIATEEEIAAGKASNLVLDGATVKVVYKEFYTTEDLSGDTATEITTAGGKAHMYGLAYGTYYLVEIRAPEGYNLLPNPVKIVIDNDSHTDNGKCEVANSSAFLLPETGGIGTKIFTIGGIALIAAAVVILILKKKKEDDDEDEGEEEE